MKVVRNKTLTNKVFPFVLGVFCVVFDQISKIVADLWLPKTSGGVVIIPYLLDFRYVENTGAAFGWFSNQRWIFLIATTFFLAIAIYVFFKVKTLTVLVNYALMLIIAGGFGNMIDRVLRGYVIDFINISCIDFFVFNIADCCVVIGCGIFILYLIMDTFKPKEKSTDK